MQSIIDLPRCRHLMVLAAIFDFEALNVAPVGTVSGILRASNGFKTSTKCLYKLYRPQIWDTMKFQMLPYEPNDVISVNKYMNIM